MTRLLHPREWAATTRSERGSATLELAVIFPVVLIIFWACLQAAFYFHARSIAFTAANEGTRVAAAEHSSTAAGTTAAASFTQRAGGTLTGTSINVSRSGTTVTTTVTGNALTILPGGSWLISQTVTLPVERVT